MDNKIAILVDTNSGISSEQAKKLGIHLVPMPFIIDGVEYFEGVNLDSQTFYDKLVNDSEISTSQPSIGVVANIYDDILKEYDYIVHIPMSSALSKTYESAYMLSNQDEYLGKVFVVDNKRISVTIEQSAMEALEMVKVGKSAKEIKEFLEASAKDGSIYLMVDTLKYLKKGGRVTPAAALLGSLLGIKPVLQIDGGKLDAFAKCRTVKSARRMMIEQVKKDIEEKFGNDVIINFVHSFNEEGINEFINEAKQEFNVLQIDDNPRNISFSIMCHTGPGVIAITCLKKHHFE